MSKVAEKITFDGDNMIVKKTYDADVMLKDAEYARQRTANSFGSDHKYIGNVDMALVNVWLKEAGVQWHDTAAVNEVIKKKLLSNEFAKLRGWEGTW